ncbi:MAG: PilZ domain-containing protein [Gammaproteobacteria bacterium]
MKSDGRRYPRFATDLPLEIRTVADGTFTGRVRNLSLGGIEFSCDRWTADELLPPGHQAFPGQPINVQVQFSISSGGAEQLIEAHGEIIVSRRLSQNEYRVGMQFITLEGDAQTALEQHLRGRTL